MTLKPGQQVLVRAHFGVKRHSGVIASINRDGAIIVSTGNGGFQTVYSRDAILPLVQR